MKHSMTLKERSFKAVSLLILGLILSPTLPQKTWASDLAETSILRGTDDDDYMMMEPPPRRYSKWSGFYIGGQAGFAEGVIQFEDTLQNTLSPLLQGTPYGPIVAKTTMKLQQQSANSASYGGFFGYNWNFNGVLFGFELEYSSANLKITSENSVNQQNTVQYDENPVNGSYGILLAAASSVKLKNMASFRVRGGYDIGNFILPYAFLGVAFGQGSIENIVVAQNFQYVVPQQTIVGNGAINIIQGIPYNNPISPPYLLLDDQVHSVYWWGYTLGVGTEINFTDNLFARLEYAFTGLDSGSKSGQPLVNKVVGGLGLRF